MGIVSGAHNHLSSASIVFTSNSFLFATILASGHIAAWLVWRAFRSKQSGHYTFWDKHLHRRRVQGLLLGMIGLVDVTVCTE